MVVLLVVVVGALIIAVLLGSPADRQASTPVGQTVAAGDGSRVDVAAIAGTVDASLVDIRADLSSGRGKVAATGVVLSATSPCCNSTTRTGSRVRPSIERRVSTWATVWS